MITPPTVLLKMMILNHTGMPRLFDADYVVGWRRDMRQLAAAPNVAVKISGLCMFDRNWTTDSILPFVEQTIEYFGVDRCMFAPATSRWRA